jgi:hypothetical protein
VEAVIATDQVYSLMPEFRSALNTKYVVRDGNNSLIGDVINLGETAGSPTVRAVYFSDSGERYVFPLQVTENDVAVKNSNQFNDGSIVYTDASCTALALLRDRYIPPMTPAFSKGVIAFSDVREGKSKLSIFAPVEEAILVQTYIWVGNFIPVDPCRLNPSSPEQWVLPLTIVSEDLLNDFPPPFSLHLE